MPTQRGRTLASLATFGILMPLAALRPAARAQSMPPAPHPAVNAPSPQGQVDAQAQAILDQARAATTALHSLKADMTFALEAHGKSASIKGIIEASRPNFVRVTFPGNKRVTVADGTYVWDYSPDSHKLFKELDPQDGDGISDTFTFISFFFDPSAAGLHSEPDADTPVVRYVGKQTWQGTPYEVIELKRQELTPNTMLAFFGPDHLLHRAVITMHFTKGDRSAFIEEMELSHVTRNPSLPSKLFAFVPPKRAILVDTAKLQLFNAKMAKQRGWDWKK